MARTVMRPAPRPANESAWKTIFFVLAVVVLLVALWYGTQTREFQVLIMGLAAAIALITIGMRPWRYAKDRGAVGLWVVGSTLFFVSILYDFSLAPTMVAGVGAGFVLGLAAARSLF